jgi:hypothetical protein
MCDTIGPNSPSHIAEDAKRDHRGQRDEALVGLPCCTGFYIYTRRSSPGTLASRPWHRGGHLGRARAHAVDRSRDLIRRATSPPVFSLQTNADGCVRAMSADNDLSCRRGA